MTAILMAIDPRRANVYRWKSHFEMRMSATRADADFRSDLVPKVYYTVT